MNGYTYFFYSAQQEAYYDSANGKAGGAVYFYNAVRSQKTMRWCRYTEACSSPTQTSAFTDSKLVAVLKFNGDIPSESNKNMRGFSSKAAVNKFIQDMNYGLDQDDQS